MTSGASVMPSSAAQRLVEAVQRDAITRDDIASTVITIAGASSDAYPVAACTAAAAQQQQQQQQQQPPAAAATAAAAATQQLERLIQDFATKAGPCRTVRGFCALLERDHPAILQRTCDSLLSEQVVRQVALEAQAAQAEQRAWARARQRRQLGLDDDDDERYHT